MSPFRIRPLAPPFPEILRWRNFVRLLAGLAAAELAWAASSVAITIDCAFCGRGQPYPHNCPRDGRSPGFAAAEMFTDLVDTARKEAARLRSINGLNLPALGEVATIAELEAALTTFIEAAESEIARCEREGAEYLNKGTNVIAESTNLSQLVGELNAELTHALTAIAETENATAAELRAAASARDENLQLQNSINEIRQEIRQVRNRLFPRLHRAAHLGWVLPPSSYRPMPAPLPPKTQRAAYALQDVSHENAPSRQSGPGRDQVNAVSVSAALPVGPGLSPNLQSLIERLAALTEKARAATARREDAIRSLERQLTEKDSQSARLSALQPERAAITAQLAAAKRNLALARQSHADRAARLSTTRETAVHAWIEWGLFLLQDKKAAALLAGADSRSGQASFLDGWREVAASSVQLGSDPLGVIANFPAQAAARGESLDDLRKDLAGAREKFRLTFIAANAALPETARPYIGQGTP